MTRANQTIYTRTLETKRGTRIWIEGLNLKAANFKEENKYDISYMGDKIVLTLKKDGEKKISSRKRYGEIIPIIDICNNKVFDTFGNDTHLSIKISKNKITISRHQILKNKLKREERIKNSLKKKKALKEGALCVGGGVLTHALHSGLNNNGIKSEVEFVAEMEPKYLQVCNRNIKYNKSFLGAIEDVEIDDIPPLDILSLSLPCTGHSPQGKTSNNIKNAEEHKSAATSIFGAMKFILFSNPSIIISENVVQAKDSASYTLLKAELRRIGYNVKEYTLDHKQAGSIEKRSRYYFVAYSSGLHSYFKDLEIPKFPKKYKKIADIIEENDEWMSSNYFNSRDKKNKESGRNFKTQFIEKNSTHCGVIPRLYAKRQISNPHYKEGNQIRLFSVNEHKKIKGLPEEFNLSEVPKTVAHEILGQSVLYNSGYGIAQMIAKNLKRIK